MIGGVGDNIHPPPICHHLVPLLLSSIPPPTIPPTLYIPHLTSTALECYSWILVLLDALSVVQISISSLYALQTLMWFVAGVVVVMWPWNELHTGARCRFGCITHLCDCDFQLHVYFPLGIESVSWNRGMIVEWLKWKKKWGRLALVLLWSEGPLRLLEPQKHKHQNNHFELFKVKVDAH